MKARLASLVRFWRRLPLWIDALNEIADVNDVWRYGTDVAESRRLHLEARNLRFAAEQEHDRTRRLRNEIADMDKRLHFALRHASNVGIHRIPDDYQVEIHAAFRIDMHALDWRGRDLGRLVEELARALARGIVEKLAEDAGIRPSTRP